MSRNGQSQNIHQTPKPISQLVTKKMPPDPIISEKKTVLAGVPYQHQPKRPIILSDITSSHQQTQNQIGQNTISKALIPCTATSVTAHGVSQHPQNGQIRINYNGRNENIPIKQGGQRVVCLNQTTNQNRNSSNFPPQSQTSVNNCTSQQGQANKGNSQVQQKQVQLNQVQPKQVHQQQVHKQQAQQQPQQYNPAQLLQYYRQQIARQLAMQPKQSMTMTNIPPQYQQQVMAHFMRQRLGNMGGSMNLRPQYRQQQQPQRFVRLPNNLMMPVYNHPFSPVNNRMPILPLQQLANNEHEIQYCIGKPFMLGSPGLGTPSYVADLGHFKILGVD